MHFLSDAWRHGMSALSNEQNFGPSLLLRDFKFGCLLPVERAWACPYAEKFHLLKGLWEGRGECPGRSWTCGKSLDRQDDIWNIIEGPQMARHPLCAQPPAEAFDSHLPLLHHQPGARMDSRHAPCQALGFRP
jgi:hypothetical protein